MNWVFWLLVTLFILLGVYVILRFILHPIARDRALMEFKWRYWLGIAFVFLASWGLTAIVCYFNAKKEPIKIIEHYCSSEASSTLPYGEIVVESLKHLADKKMAEDEGAGYFMWIILANSVIFSGLLISAIIGWNDRRSAKCAAGLVRYKQHHLNKWWVAYLDGKFKENYKYAVVIGANEVASSVVKHLLKKGNQYVILQTSSNIDTVRQVLQSHLTEEEYKRVIIYNALRDSLEEIKALCLADASEIYILGENTVFENGETYHDTMNMRCLNLVAEVLKAAENRKEEKVCHVLFEYQTTYSVFQHSDIAQDVKKVIDFRPFNRYESWARRVMVDNVSNDLVDRDDCADKSDKSKSIIREEIDYMPLDGYEGIAPEDEKHVHFIVVGMSKMGVAMATQALHLAHFPNTYNYPNQRTRITFIDANADKEMLFFKGRYTTLFELVRHRYLDASRYIDRDTILSEYGWCDPMEDYRSPWKHLGTNGKNFMDVEIEFVKGELQCPSVCEYLKTVSDDPTSKLTIAVCLPYTHEAIAASLYMPREVYTKEQLQQIWVYQREASDIISNLTSGKKEDQFELYHKLRPFGMVYGEYMDNESHLIKAQLVNGTYWGKELPDIFCTDKVNSDILNAWKELDVAKQWSNRLVADSIYVRIRSVSRMQDFLEKLSRHSPNVLSMHILDYQENQCKVYEKELAVCEHHRWNVEQVMMGYIPCDKTQFAEFKDMVNANVAKDVRKKKKDSLKKPNKKIHLDICGMDKDGKPLNDVDPGIGGADIKLNNAIPHIALLVDRYENKRMCEMAYHLISRLISRITDC